MRALPLRLFRLVLGLSLIVGTPAVIAAAPTGISGSQITFTSLGHGTQTLSGTNPTLDLYVPPPTSGAFDGSSLLQVVYSRSPLLDTSRSSVSIFVNGIDVAGRLLQAGAGTEAVLRVPVPTAALLAHALNHIQLAFTLSDHSRYQCGIPDPALNVTIYGSSSFRYSMISGTRTIPPDLSTLPAPFVTSGSTPVTRIGVSLAPRATAVELTAAADVLARFGEDQSLAPPAVGSYALPALATRGGQQPLLFVGTPRDDPALGRLHAPTPLAMVGGRWEQNGTPLPADEGLIVETTNPWNASYPALAITGNGMQGITRAAMVLDSATSRGLLHGSYALVPTMPNLANTDPWGRSTISLTEAGYGGTTLEGAGEHDARYTFDLPRVPLAAGSFDLVFGHASTADPALSSVRIDLNGQPLASRRFSAGDPPRASWSVPLPAGALQLGPNTLTVRFYLGQQNATCSGQQSGSIWATVDGSSTLTMPTGTTGTADLGMLPFPAVVNGSPDGSLIVVRGNLERHPKVLQTAVELGAQSRTDDPHPVMVTVGQLTPKLLTNHTVILDNLPVNSWVMQRVESRLPLRAQNGLQFYEHVSADGVAIQEHGEVGIVEEVSSPWVRGGSVIVLEATRPHMQAIARAALLRGGLSGTAATIDLQGRVQAFSEPSLAVPESLLHQRPIRYVTAAGIVAILLVFGTWAFRGRRAAADISR